VRQVAEVSYRVPGDYLLKLAHQPDSDKEKAMTRPRLISLAHMRKHFMSERQMYNSHQCQLQVLPAAAAPQTTIDKFRLYLLRLLVASEKRLGRQGYAIRRIEPQNQEPPQPSSITGNHQELPIEEGDWVTVRTLEDIQGTLDSEGRCKGLEFMSDMAIYCGRIIRVRKKVRAIFDERAWKMLRIKNTYILDECICDGRGMYDKEGCDRCCYFFWKADWLKKRGHGVEVQHSNIRGSH